MKVVLITGASSGIGKAIGEYLSENGYIVYGTSRNPSQYPNSKFELLELDVRNTTTISSAITYIIQKSNRLDIVINNAGVGITGALEEIPTLEIRNNFDVNFFGPIEVIKAVLPQLRLQKSGLIINITSIAAHMGLPYRSIYSSSKGALHLLTEAISMEVKPFGIKICNVAPGDFATNIAAGRFHAPISENSAYTKYPDIISEMNAHVDGGDNPLDMAIAIRKIIETKNPKIHYKVGAIMQKFSIVLKRILPGLWYEKMMMNHYKL